VPGARPGRLGNPPERRFAATGWIDRSLRARVSVDPVLKRRFAVDGKEPTTVIVVAVEQAFQHCPKALVRSDLWKAGSGDRPKGVPTLGDFAAARTPGTDSSTYDADYARRMPSELY
jgi:hypothetical protein